MGIPEDVALFEQELGGLIIKYEQYFLGLEKREPLKQLKEVELLGRKYQGFQIINTMVKFRYFSGIARLNSYKQYWGRITRLMEEGKYSRDRFKMEMHAKDTTPRPPVEAKPAEKKKTLDPEVAHVFNSFLEARKACLLPVDNISPEMIAAAIEKQKPAIMKKYNCSGVDFKVVIENGMPKIKARPRK